MSAASVTGVGQGSALGVGQKGYQNFYLGVEQLIGPRVVAAGIATVPTAGNTLAVTFPEPLPGVVSDYAIFTVPYAGAATPTGSVNSHVTTIITGGVQLAGFNVFDSQVNGTFHWEVVRVNNATVTITSPVTD